MFLRKTCGGHSATESPFCNCEISRKLWDSGLRFPPKLPAPHLNDGIALAWLRAGESMSASVASIRPTDPARAGAASKPAGAASKPNVVELPTKSPVTAVAARVMVIDDSPDVVS